MANKTQHDDNGWAECPKCDGLGAVGGTGQADNTDVCGEECDRCEGTGEVAQEASDGEPKQGETEDAPVDSEASERRSDVRWVSGARGMHGTTAQISIATDMSATITTTHEHDNGVHSTTAYLPRQEFAKLMHGVSHIVETVENEKPKVYQVIPNGGGGPKVGRATMEVAEASSSQIENVDEHRQAAMAELVQSFADGLEEGMRGAPIDSLTVDEATEAFEAFTAERRQRFLDTYAAQCAALDGGNTFRICEPGRQLDGALRRAQRMYRERGAQIWNALVDVERAEMEADEDAFAEFWKKNGGKA